MRRNMQPYDDDDDDDAYTRQQLLGEEWWTSDFLALMRPGQDSSELARGRRLAERGQVVIRGTFPGGVEAIVLGATGGARKVTLWFNDLEDDWTVLFRIFSVRQDLFSRLLSGEYLIELNDMLIGAGITIIPSTMMDLDYRCDCESDHHTCSHIVATYLSLGKIINEDPMILFLLRGKTREEIISGVTGVVTGSDDTQEDDNAGSGVNLEGEVNPPAPDAYYSPGPEFETIRFRSIYQPGGETSIISLLGRSPFKIGQINLADLIAAFYPLAARYVSGLSGFNQESAENNDPPAF